MDGKYDEQIKALKPAQGFIAPNEKERQLISRRAKTLKEFGQIAFDVVTKRNRDGKGFKVAAL